jgi:hypothetical protein
MHHINPRRIYAGVGQRGEPHLKRNVSSRRNGVTPQGSHKSRWAVLRRMAQQIARELIPLCLEPGGSTGIGKRDSERKQMPYPNTTRFSERNQESAVN